MAEKKEKTPEQLADKELNKKIAKSIASRKYDIKKHEAAIKKLQKEIKKIVNGELVPEIDGDSDDESSDAEDIEELKRKVRDLEREVDRKDSGTVTTPFRPYRPSPTTTTPRLIWTKPKKLYTTTSWTSCTSNRPKLRYHG